MFARKGSGDHVKPAYAFKPKLKERSESPKKDKISMPWGMK